MTSRGKHAENLRSPWRKGQSGNPRGRPPAPWKAWLAQEEPALRELLVRLAHDGRIRPETRVRIAEFLLDHTHGQPKQTVEADVFPHNVTLSISRRAYEDLRHEGKELPPVLVPDDDGNYLTPEKLNDGRTKRR